MQGIPSRVSQDIRGYYETAALALSDPPRQRGPEPAGFTDHTEAGK